MNPFNYLQHTRQILDEVDDSEAEYPEGDREGLCRVDRDVLVEAALEDVLGDDGGQGVEAARHSAQGAGEHA